MILFHQVVEVLYLADLDLRLTGFLLFFVELFQGSRIGPALVNGHLLGHAVEANSLPKEPQGRLLVSLLGQQEIHGIAFLIHGPIEIDPLTIF